MDALIVSDITERKAKKMETFEDVVRLVKSTDRIIFDEAAAHRVITKGAADYVTFVDLGVQHYLEKELHSLFPSIAFMGEEEGESVLHQESACWILDPIDGTTNLIHDYRCSSISLGLWDKGQIVFGVVYQPYTKEVFTAQKGKGAYLGETRLKVSAAASLGESLLSFGTAPYHRELSPRTFALLPRVFAKCQDIRRSGSAAVDLCGVAAGRTDGFFELFLKPWDYAAGSLIVKEAGGTVTDWQGEALSFAQGSSVLATNGKLHEPLLNEIREV